MITWLVGENSFEVHEAKRALLAAFSGEPELIDGSELTLARLPDLFMGISLFAEERLVIISELSANATVWGKLPEWLPRVNDAIHLVFIDKKPDKRTTSYKALKSVATVREFAPWTERDTTKAEAWVMQRAAAKHVTLARGQAKHLVARVGVDQWQLAQALEILSLLDTITNDAIDTHIPNSPSENVFALFETALQGDAVAVHDMLATLKTQQEPHMLLGLLSSQVLSLAAVVAAAASASARTSAPEDPAKDFAIHPFVVSKMRRYVHKVSKSDVAAMIEAFAVADAGVKRSKAEPWMLIERALLEVVMIRRR